MKKLVSSDEVENWASGDTTLNRNEFAAFMHAIVGTLRYHEAQAKQRRPHVTQQDEQMWEKVREQFDELAYYEAKDIFMAGRTTARRDLYKELSKHLCHTAECASVEGRDESIRDDRLCDALTAKCTCGLSALLRGGS